MPMFKKSGGKIFAVQFNKAEERVLDCDIEEWYREEGGKTDA